MMTGDWRRWLKVFALLVGLPASLVAEPVDLQVSGTGWLENRRLERSLDRLRPDSEASKLDANGVEDAVFFLFSALADDGYLKPAVTVELTRPNGERLTHTFDASLTNLLPRPLEAVRVNFQIERGVRYRFGEITVTGNTGKRSPEEVRALVLPEATGFGFGGDYAYSPPALRRGLNRVVDTLALEGHAQARAEAPRVTMDDASGEVTISVEVQAGPQSWVDEIVVTGDHPTDLRWPGLDEREQQPWSFAWEQDAMEILRHSLYQRGYPDVRIRSSRVERPGAEGRRLARVTFSIVTGPRVVVKDVRFAGEHGVKESVLRRRVRTEPGEPLDPLRFEAARYRLARLGAFRRVELDYEPATGPERSPVFTLSPLPLWEVHLLAGYGSYEQLRGGVELRRNNVLDRAHQARLELVQSFKSSRGEATYTVPELFGEAVDGTVQLFGLQREELAFLRQEYGGTVSLRRRRLPWINAEGTISYTYQSLRNEENELTTRDEDLTQTIAASVDLNLSRDRRDNPLQPRRGYRWFVQAELAAVALGGEVDYQRMEAGFSYHTSWGRGRWVHVGLTHGAVLTLGADNDRALPVNRRFYPGGDSSIRGYQLGEAAPRAPDGRFLGAKSVTLLNLELEQAIWGRLSIVGFLDVLGSAVELESYPWDEHLISVGLGVRYQTIIGPVRLEYGHNLERREGDPSGTLHFSLGFPF